MGAIAKYLSSQTANEQPKESAVAKYLREKEQPSKPAIPAPVLNPAFAQPEFQPVPMPRPEQPSGIVDNYKRGATQFGQSFMAGATNTPAPVPQGKAQKINVGSGEKLGQFANAVLGVLSLTGAPVTVANTAQDVSRAEEMAYDELLRKRPDLLANIGGPIRPENLNKQFTPMGKTAKQIAGRQILSDPVLSAAISPQVAQQGSYSNAVKKPFEASKEMVTKGAFRASPEAQRLYDPNIAVGRMAGIPEQKIQQFEENHPIASIGTGIVAGAPFEVPAAAIGRTATRAVKGTIAAKKVAKETAKAAKQAEKGRNILADVNEAYANAKVEARPQPKPILKQAEKNTLPKQPAMPEAAPSDVKTLPIKGQLKTGASGAQPSKVDFGKQSYVDNEPAINDQVGAIHPLFRKFTETKPPKPDSAESFRAKVNRNPKEKTSTFSEKVQKLRTQFIDDLVPLENLEKSVTGKVASAENSLYKQSRLLKGTPTKASTIIRTKLAPIIDSARNAGFSEKDFGDYVLAVHARDLQAKGIETGFTPAEIDDVIKRFGNPKMETARKELIKYNNALLDDLAASGRLSTQLVAELKKKHPNYVPLFRAFDDDKVEFAQGLSKAIASIGNPVKELKGSKRQIIDPLENIIKNTYRIVNVADKTRVMGQLGKLAKADAEGQFVRRLNPGEEVGRKNIVKAFENGQSVQYEVQPDVYKTLKNLDQESSNFLVEILSKPASTLRAGATLTPEFSLRNPVRDVLNAFVVSKSGFNPIIDFPIALAQVVGQGRSISIMGKKFKVPGEVYNKFLLDNGGYGNVLSMDRNIHRETLKKVLKQPITDKFINIVNPKAWLALLQKIGDTTETATKLGEYRAALRKGVSGEEAAYRARDLMDFARAGYSIRPANRIVAFLNANIQGKSVLIRAIKENPVRVTTKAVSAITLPTVGVYLAQKYMANDVQKQTIDDAPTWLRDTFWLLPIPGTNQVARIPKPFDLAPIFANLPERLLSYIDKNDPNAFDKFAKDTFASYSIPVMISGFLPIIEGMANYSFFRQAPIIPRREQDINFPDQYDVNTSEVSKVLAKGVDTITQGEGMFKNFGSPRIVENTIVGATAGLGRMALTATDALLETHGLKEKSNKAEKAPSQLPVLRAFLVNQTTTGKAVDDLYNLKEKLTREKGSLKLRGEEFKHSILLDVEIATKEISEISKEMRDTENDPRLSPEAKRRRLDALNNQRNKIARDTMSAIKTKIP